MEVGGQSEDVSDIVEMMSPFRMSTVPRELRNLEQVPKELRRESLSFRGKDGLPFCLVDFESPIGERRWSFSGMTTPEMMTRSKLMSASNVIGVENSHDP